MKQKNFINTTTRGTNTHLFEYFLIVQVTFVQKLLHMCSNNLKGLAIEI